MKLGQEESPLECMCSPFRSIEEEAMSHAKCLRFQLALAVGSVVRGTIQAAEKVTMKVEKTEKGVKVIETSDGATVAKLIQAHADVVTKIVETGFEEAHKEHAVPGPEKKK